MGVHSEQDDVQDLVEETVHRAVPRRRRTRSGLFQRTGGQRPDRFDCVVLDNGHGRRVRHVRDPVRPGGGGQRGDGGPRRHRRFGHHRVRRRRRLPGGTWLQPRDVRRRQGTHLLVQRPRRHQRPNDHRRVLRRKDHRRQPRHDRGLPEGLHARRRGLRPRQHCRGDETRLRSPGSAGLCRVGSVLDGHAHAPTGATPHRLPDHPGRLGRWPRHSPTRSRRRR